MKKYQLAPLGLALAITAAPAIAAKGDVPNGQPFQALQSQIDDNLALIEQNADVIAELNVDVAAINGRIDSVEANIDQVELNVAANSADIADAFARIAAAEGDLQGLGAELAVLAAEHAADSAAFSAAIDAINAELVNLNDLRQALADDLNAQLAALSAAVGDNALAIDSLVLQLVTLNAQLTSINSSIMDLQNRQDAIEASAAQFADDLARLEARVDDLEGAVDTLSSYHLYTFSGIATDVPEDSLSGWTQCYSATYADEAHPEDMVAACTGSKIMLACRPVGDDTLTVAAYADRDEVFFDTGDRNNDVHEANGVDWYFSYSYSMGFAPVGEGVMRSSADVQDRSSPLRLSWHTNDHYANGWRCGSNVWLNHNANWEKVVYQAN